ncbi:PAN2-PAN3 deadenylation complex subunit PAN3-like isoform X2 [Ctenocephalides felis]|nr:PAN2-PAN3 deadenylation complex subunit PAN3-like isoform X2 [Ctenocephalides felis]XP_026471413.1 PAN2-PAN3 deadenylation complex subunit PAN3-like isoform X2 [Ctenocephalides felis]XP_026471414.1 PAN2-PAN3 deadenylation complex subunit PAN3-like isoform X2 [Ctenocephalides felis]XP_026472747.1 PAN2-PAN3 deadenylation complex subunit PAN3-like isoform X2 [Ctenocephalides felis]XP_026472748.1 PAN2-PAN3 deadenylation complex subunit PAN3-like isoform X2 [Ctenocephalides felis]XP_026472749.1 
MDSIFLPHTSSNGVPQESKLATYMNHSTSTPTQGLAQAMSKVNLESPLPVKKVTPQSPEFIPGNSHIVSSVSSSSSQQSSSLFTYSAGSESPLSGRLSYGPRGDSPLGRNVTAGVSPRLSPQDVSPPLSASVHQENVGGTTYFYHASAGAEPLNGSAGYNGLNNSYISNSGNVSGTQGSGPLNYSVYNGPSSNVASIRPNSALSAAFFMPEELRQDLIAMQQDEILCNAGECNLPMEVDNYHSLTPLESPVTSLIGHKGSMPASTYRAVNTTTGVRYCLRRLHGCRLPSTKCMVVVDMWKKIEHSNIVQLREVFTTKAFGDNSMLFVYDYHTNAQTLLSKYFPSMPPLGEQSGSYTDPFPPGDARPYSHKSREALRAQAAAAQAAASGHLMLPETEIWAIVMQLTAALRIIHSANLACRTLDPTKIIVCGKRVRLSFLGISDILSFDASNTNNMALINHYQQDDLTALGKLVLALARGSLSAVQVDQIQNSVEIISRIYSNDLRNLIIYLLSQQQRRTVTDLMPMIGARFYTQLDALQARSDVLEDHLAREMENGRLYRLLVKLGTINERPELQMDTTWSETGDRYMLKLFRDFLFHSVTDDGRPWIDQAHIVSCLNKLDSGVNEKIQLMSRDEQSVLVVTYGELKHCLEQAFEEIVIAAS